MPVQPARLPPKDSVRSPQIKRAGRLDHPGFGGIRVGIDGNQRNMQCIGQMSQSGIHTDDSPACPKIPRLRPAPVGAPGAHPAMPSPDGGHAHVLADCPTAAPAPDPVLHVNAFPAQSSALPPIPWSGDWWHAAEPHNRHPATRSPSARDLCQKPGLHELNSQKFWQITRGFCPRRIVPG